MSDFPLSQTPLFVHPWTRHGSLFQMSRLQTLTPGTVTWVANQAIYMPISLPWPYPVNRVWWVNGSTVTTANCDFGIYTPSGSRIYSTGSTTQAGASVPQFVTPTTPFVLPAGRYFFAWACDSTTSHAFGVLNSTAGFGALGGLLTQATALPLPATATFATMPTTVGPVMAGITRTNSSTVF